MRGTFQKVSFYISALAMAAGSCSLVLAADPGLPPNLQDLPQEWTGIAGDLVVRVPATFSIQKILKVTRNTENPHTATAYEVEATMTFGKNKVPVNLITLRSYGPRHKNLTEFYMRTNDVLSPMINALLIANPASGTYELKEVARFGKRSFVFSAPVRR